MRSKAPRPNQTRPAAEEKPPVFYRIHALLHTMHAIERYEDQLCSLMHEIQTAGSVSPVVSHELRDLLADMPSDEYQDDLNAIRVALESAAPTSAVKRRSAKPVKAAAKKTIAVKKTATAKKATAAKRK